MSLGKPGCVFDLLITDIQTHRDVLADGGGVQERLIKNRDEIPADIAVGEVVEASAMAVAIKGDVAAVWLIKVSSKLHSHGLA